MQKRSPFTLRMVVRKDSRGFKKIGDEKQSVQSETGEMRQRRGYQEDSGGKC